MIWKCVLRRCVIFPFREIILDIVLERFEDKSFVKFIAKGCRENASSIRLRYRVIRLLFLRNRSRDGRRRAVRLALLVESNCAQGK